MKHNIFLSMILVGTSLSAGYVDHLHLRGGVSKAFMDEADSSKVDTKTIKSVGWIYDLSAVFNVADEGFFSEFKPYIDFSGRHYDDRSANTAGVGLYHDFDPVAGFTPFASAGIGYGQMRWENVPLKGTVDRDKGMSSAVGTLQGGLYMPLLDWLDLSAGVRMDVYSFKTEFKTEDHTTSQTDNFALSGLIGLRFKFPSSASDEIIAADEPDTKLPPANMAAAATAATTAAAVTTAVTAPCDLSKTPRHLYFAFDSAELDAQAKKILDDSAACMNEHPETVIEFEGHADSTGPAAYNQQLSLKRAISARDYGVTAGIAASQTNVAAKGETMPIASNATREGRAKNRRVDIYFIDTILPVTFAYNDTSITGQVEKLNGLLEMMQKNPQSAITIVGHTDDVGSQKYNLKLSRKRAEAVKAFLVGNGIDAARINVEAKGKLEPAVEGKDDASRAKNRRAEMTVRH